MADRLECARQLPVEREPDAAPVRLIHVGEAGELAKIFADQDGVIRVGQALALDLTRDEVCRRKAAKEWIGLGAGVYRLAAHSYTEAARVRAAAWVSGGVLDRTTAAWWHGALPDLIGVPTLSVSRHKSSNSWAGGEWDVVRRTFCAEDRTEVRGVKVTSKEMAVLGAVPLVEQSSRFLDDMLRTGQVSMDGLRTALTRNPRMRGLGSARDLLAVLDSDTQSAAERVFRQLLREAGISGWVQQHPFGGWAIDFAWPELKIAVEIDGWAFHRSHKEFQRDIRKRNALIVAGWLPLSFSWHDLTERPIGSIETVVGLIRERLATLG